MGLCSGKVVLPCSPEWTETILQASSKLHGILLAQSQSVQSMGLLYLPHDSSGLFSHILLPLNTLHLRSCFSVNNPLPTPSCLLLLLTHFSEHPRS